MKKLVFFILLGAGILYAAYYFNPGSKGAINPLGTLSLADAASLPETDEAVVRFSISPDSLAMLDSLARNAPAASEKDIPTLAAYLAQYARNDYEKTRLLFTWVATHIRYDSEGYNKGRVGNTSAERVLASRNSVCEGYSNLFEAIGTAMGLQVEKLSGYAKGIDYLPGTEFTQTNHAWNAVKIGGAWKLFDATWGSGYGTPSGNAFVAVARFEPYWFDVHPKAFVFTHFPVAAEWQLLEKPLTKAQFEALPDIGESFFKLAFDPELVFRKATVDSVSGFVKTYTIDFEARALEMPVDQQLKRDKKYSFAIEAPELEKLLVINGYAVTPFVKKGDVFYLNYKPKGNRMSINGARRQSDTRLSTIATYKVEE